MAEMLPPSFATERLDLRPIRLEDAEATSALALPAIAERLLTWRSPYPVEAVRERIERSLEKMAAGEEIDWAILHRGERCLIGWLGFFRSTESADSASFGIWLGLPWQGQGLASEAVKAGLPIAARHLGVDRITGATFPDNDASIALMLGLGMRPAGRKPAFSPVRDRDVETVLFELDV